MESFAHVEELPFSREAPEISDRRCDKPPWAPWELANSVDSRVLETSFQS